MRTSPGASVGPGLRTGHLRGALALGCALVAACSGDARSPELRDDGASQAPGDGARDAGANVVGEPDASPTPPGPPPFDWVGIVGTGQSLAVGSQAADVVSRSQPFDNKKLVDDGPDPKYPLTGGAPRFALAPLTEPFRSPLAGYDGITDYPNNIRGESPQSGMANQISALVRARTGGDYVTLHSAVGKGGSALRGIDKTGGGTPAYLGTLAEARAFTELARAEGKTFGYGALVLTHGEADYQNPEYGAGIKALLDAYNEDLKAITGQTRDIVMLASQQSARGRNASNSSFQLWRAGLEHPGKIVCTGPKYQYGYAADNLHMPAPGYRRLGEKYGEVYDLVVNQGTAWKPLQPRSATRSGNTVAVVFDVPNPPLAWDDSLEPNHQTKYREWAAGRGFEARDESNAALTITSVAITAPDTVTLTLSGTPSGMVKVSYAITPDADATNVPNVNRTGGLVEGLRGQLRDSDELVGYDEEAFSLTVANGSRTVRLSGSGNFSTRALRDVVTAAGAPKNWTIVSFGDTKVPTATTRQLTMSEAWPGASGTIDAKIHHDLHNYAVHSQLIAP